MCLRQVVLAVDVGRGRIERMGFEWEDEIVWLWGRGGVASLGNLANVQLTPTADCAATDCAATDGADCAAGRSWILLCH